jgi:hypothetical protein
LVATEAPRVQIPASFFDFSGANFRAEFIALPGRRPRLDPSKYANGTRGSPHGTRSDFIRAAGG